MGFFKTLYRNRAHFVILTDFDDQGRDVYLRFDTGAVYGYFNRIICC